MAEATNAQVQNYVDQRVRPRCQQIRDLYLRCKDDKAVIDDVYENLTTSPTWTDGRTDSPPHLMTPNDVLAWNAFITGLIALVEGGSGAADACAAAPAQYPVILDGCVHDPFSG